jgi:hypothetical protein
LIVKERKIPLKIQVAEALLRRLPTNFINRQQLQDELDKRWAGYWGECSLDYHLSFLDEKKYLIFHDLNLPLGENTFQIDTLLLSSSFAVIIEVKNIAGTLFFDRSFHQLIRTSSNGVEEGFPDPVTQVKLHEHQLRSFLDNNRLPQVPLEHVVVITTKNSVLKTNPGERKIFQKVFKAPHLLSRIQNLELMYPDKILSTKDLQRYSRILVKKNTPPKKMFMDRYLLSKDQLMPGIHCPSCSFISMKRIRRNWYCPACEIYSKEAHIKSLRDYFLLIDSKINIPQFREFAGLESRSVAARLLSSTNFPNSGTTKNRFFHPPEDLYSGEAPLI